MNTKTDVSKISIALAQVMTGNTCDKLLNKILKQMKKVILTVFRYTLAP